MPVAAPPAHPPLAGGLFTPPPRPRPAAVPAPAVPPWARPTAAAPAKAVPPPAPAEAPATPAPKEAACRGRRTRGPSPFRNPYAKKKPAAPQASPADPFDFNVILERLARDPSGGSAELGGRTPPRG